MEPRIYIHPEPFVLESGATLAELRIAYHTYGTLTPERDNVVWVCHALTANSEVADWWPHTVEEGCFLDPAHHFVVCANILGSHYGTTGPLHVNPATGEPYYADFPAFTIRDMVAAHRTLADALGIDRIATLVGRFRASAHPQPLPHRHRGQSFAVVDSHRPDTTHGHRGRCNLRRAA